MFFVKVAKKVKNLQKSHLFMIKMKVSKQYCASVLDCITFVDVFGTCIYTGSLHLYHPFHYFRYICPIYEVQEGQSDRCRVTESCRLVKEHEVSQLSLQVLKAKLNFWKKNLSHVTSVLWCDIFFLLYSHCLLQNLQLQLNYFIPLSGSFNSSPLNAAYMHQLSMPALVHIMACRLFCAKPLPEQVLSYRLLDVY